MDMSLSLLGGIGAAFDPRNLPVEDALVMGDLALLHPAGSCACGTPTPWFEILGRAGTSSNKSCAAAAAELLPAS